MKQVTTILLMLLCLFSAGMANDIRVANPVLSGQDITEKFVYVEFDIGWKNSWRNNINHDAAWIFVKYQKTGSGEWYHASLSPNSELHNTGSAGSDATIIAVTDKKGVFFKRTNEGKGNFGSNAIKIRWNYGDDFLKNDLKEDVMRVAVFAIEMCYVPEGDYYLGDGHSAASFRKVDSNTPVKISNNPVVVRAGGGDNALANVGITVSGTEGIDYNNDGSYDNPNYPTGYKSIYCMKYEISQEQYVDFLNTLTRVQQASRISTTIMGKSNITNTFVMTNTTAMQNRNAIRCRSQIDSVLPLVFYCDYNQNGEPNEDCDGQNIACNYLKFQDGLQYAAWAGLRPMTEFEFEKACRGTLNPVAGEYAWGDNARSQSINPGNFGCSNENFLAGNCHFGHHAGTYAGPFRVGIFAEISAGDRVNAGATYWGIMEMSGNLWEGCITFGTETGRKFKNLQEWQFDNVAGAALRGGDWTYNYMMYIDFWAISARQYSEISYNSREAGYGFRCVRFDD
ncbi:MAG: SUMF1/EgtB/PvdO family nonheme iron enzyme [Candidatus Kapabacteria bacterium]|nr:SUMF1/EgtB/PvdO family nonheme iron enzyme [Candidatus Kapabacteria bacterium]